MERRRRSGRPAGSSPSQTRDHILDVAEQLVAERGVEGLRLKDVAARAGIRAPSIFAHFDGRDALLEAVSTRVLAGALDLLREDPARPAPVVLGAWIEGLTRHLHAHPARVRLLLRDLAHASISGVDTGTAARRLAARIERRMATLLRRGVAEGAFRSVRADGFYAHILGGLLTSLAWGGWDDEGRSSSRTPPGRIARELRELALRHLDAGA